MHRHRNRFADLTPESTSAPTGNRPGPQNPPRARRRPSRRWLIAALVTVSIGAVWVLATQSCGPRPSGDHDRMNTVRVAHGPTATAEGVPVGYSRDRAGAATAAVNSIQALTQAGQGRIRMATVEHALVPRDPGPGLRRSLGIGANRAPERNVVNLVPAAVSVPEFSPSSARVTVWTVAVSRAAINDGDRVSVITAWATHTVSLVWEAEDWKAKDLVSQLGPTPEQTVAPDTQSLLNEVFESGYYSFYVN